jgi:hypothetical protein
MPILGGTGSASEYAYRSYLVDYPDPFDWPDQLDVDPGKIYTAGYAKITGIKTKLKLRVSVGSSYSLYQNVFDNNQTVTFDNNNPALASFDEYSDPNQRFKPGLGLDNPAYELIRSNQSVNLSVNTPRVVTTDFSKTYTTNVSIGNSVQDWIVRTREFDSTPNSFSFTSIGSTTTSTQVFSNTITLAGIETGFNVGFGLTVSNDLAGAAIINGTVYQSITGGPPVFANVKNGDIIQLRTFSSSSFNSRKILTVRVGSFSTTWSVTTEPENLNIIFTPSDFTDQTNINLSTNTDSNQITLSGFSLNSSFPLTLSNTSASYEIERGAAIVKTFTDPAANVSNNDKIRVRLPSSGSYDTNVSTTVNIGNSSADWIIRTRSAPPPDPNTGGGGNNNGGTTPPSTVPVTRYNNNTIADHLYSTGSPITSGRLTINDVAGTITLSGNQNIFFGESTAGVRRTGTGIMEVRMTLPYDMPQMVITLNGTLTAGAGQPGSDPTRRITSISVSGGAISADGLCRVYNITATNNVGGAAFARNYSFNFDLNGYAQEGLSTYFKVFASQQPGTQLLRTLYDNRRTNHETAFVGNEESGGYNAVQNLGYAYPGTTSPKPSGTQALYKFVNRTTSTATINNGYDTFLTIDSTEIPAGWTRIGNPYAWVPL